MDPIQHCLSRWHEHGDQAAFTSAFRLLRCEWVVPVARFLRLPAASVEVEQLLSDMLCATLLAQPGAPPRALAPGEHSNPAAWRRRVLLNALLDNRRRQDAHRGAVVRAAAAAAPPVDLPPQVPQAEEVVALRQMLQKVVTILPQVEVLRRTVLALELDLPIPAEWQAELAQVLREPLAAVCARVTEHEAHPFDEDLRVRVVYGQPIAQAREAYRKTLSRSREQVIQLIHGGQA